MSKTQSTLMLLVLAATLTACGSEPSGPTNPPTTDPTGDQLSAILSTPGPATTCLADSDFPPPLISQQTSPDDPCPDAGSACAISGGYPILWCKADGTAAIVMCEKGAWVIKAKKCP